MLSKIKKYFSKIRWKNLLFQLALIIVIFIAISFWQTRHVTKGEAPAFSGQLLDDTSVALSNYRGKPLLLHFWATWCPVCKLEQHSISSIANANIESEYQTLTIASWSGNETDVKQYMDNENLHFPVLVDPDGSIAKLYGVQGVPSSFVIDANGIIQFVEQGYTTETGLRLRLWWLQNN